jgi:hypothetical protein
MYKTISNEIIRQIQPCYDPSKYITDENEELPIKDWIQKYRKVVPPKDILWILLRKEFLSEKDLRLFAVWCTRETLKLVKKPDKRSVEACDVAERYANGEATKDELDAAYDTAPYVVNDAAYAAAYSAYYLVNDAAKAAYYAANDANFAAFAAAFDSASDAFDITNYYAINVAAYYASNIARTAQVDKLLTYF